METIRIRLRVKRVDEGLIGHMDNEFFDAFWVATCPKKLKQRVLESLKERYPDKQFALEAELVTPLDLDQEDIEP